MSDCIFETVPVEGDSPRWTLNPLIQAYVTVVFDHMRATRPGWLEAQSPENLYSHMILAIEGEFSDDAPLFREMCDKADEMRRYMRALQGDG